MFNNDKVLLLLKRNSAGVKWENVIKKYKPQKLFLCPVEYGCAKIISKIIEVSRIEGIAVQEIDFVSEFNKNAFEYKNDFISFVGSLSSKPINSNRDLGTYFKCPFNDFSLWWFSLISERSPSKTEFYPIFIKVLTILDLRTKLGADRIWSGDDSIAKMLDKSKADLVVFLKGKNSLNIFFNDLKAVIIGILKVAKFYLVLIKRTIDIAFFHLKSKDRSSFSESQLFLVTAFPHLDSEALEKGEFVNKAYGALSESLKLSKEIDFSWVGMFVKVEPHTWGDALKFLAKLKKLNIRFRLLEEDLSFWLIFRLAVYHLIVVLKFLRSWPVYPSLFNYRRSSSISLNLWPIFKNEFASSLTGKVFLDSLCYYFLFKKLTKSFTKNSQIIHFCEMQAWEKALHIAAKENSVFECIGLQHTITPLMLLSYFNHSSEKKGSNFISKKPLPDRLGCVGQVTRNIFRDNGWADKDLFISGAFRFHDFNRHKRDKIKAGKRENQIVVAFSISPYVNKELLCLLHDAFNHKECSFKVLLKPHPCQSLERTIKGIGLKFNPQIFVITHYPLSEIVPKSKVMLVKDSSSIFEALINDLPVIVPQLYSVVDLCPLSGIIDLPIYTKDAASLFKMVDSIINGKYQHLDSEKGELFLERYLKIFQNKDQYCESILSNLKH